MMCGTLTLIQGTTFTASQFTLLGGFTTRSCSYQLSRHGLASISQGLGLHRWRWFLHRLAIEVGVDFFILPRSGFCKWNMARTWKFWWEPWLFQEKWRLVGGFNTFETYIIVKLVHPPRDQGEIQRNVLEKTTTYKTLFDAVQEKLYKNGISKPPVVWRCQHPTQKTEKTTPEKKEGPSWFLGQKKDSDCLEKKHILQCPEVSGGKNKLRGSFHRLSTRIRQSFGGLLHLNQKKRNLED